MPAAEPAWAPFWNPDRTGAYRHGSSGRWFRGAAYWVWLQTGESRLGFVSRVAPVHTAVRNCTRDEGRSFEVGNQVLISSHRKLLLSNAMVVNVAEKSKQDFDRHD